MSEALIKIKECDLTPEELTSQTDRFRQIFTNGYDTEDNQKISMKDALTLNNASFMIPRVLTTFVQEGIEPLLIGSALLQRIQYVPGMQTVFPAIDVLHAAEAAENGSLPIWNINMAGGQTLGITVKRHGLQMRVNQNFINQSTYPWLQYWMRLAGNALARHKEEYIFSFITSLGVCIFDNAVTTRTTGATANVPIKGITTGRNVRGQFNGSMTADDIFDMYAQLATQGFIPDTLLMHPLAWIMFVKDPVFREFAIQAGGGSFFANFTGNPASLANPFYNFGGLGQGQGQEVSVGKVGGGTNPNANNTIPFSQTQTSAPQLPGYLPTPFRILVSPFVRFDPDSRTTDIMMFNSRNLGALVVDYEPRVNAWDEKQYGIHNMTIEESYGFGILNEGQAIGIARNVVIRPNEFVLPARSVINISESSSVFETVDGTGAVTNFGASPIAPITR